MCAPTKLGLQVPIDEGDADGESDDDHGEDGGEHVQEGVVPLVAEAAVEPALWLVQRRLLAVRPVDLAPGIHHERLVEAVVRGHVLQIIKSSANFPRGKFKRSGL